MMNPNDYKPGSHVALVCGGTDADLVGIELRLAGWTIRDSLVAYLGGKVFYVWLARAPLEPGLSIAEHVVKYGEGAINIDAVRVGAEIGGWGGGGSAFAQGGLSRTGGAPRPTVGRFPCNVLIDSQVAEMLEEGARTFPKVESMGDVLSWLERLLA